MRFKFKQIPVKDAKVRVLEICKAENLNINENVIEEAIIICRGDMRKIVNMLQSLKLSVSSGIKRDSIMDKDRFFEIMSVIPLDTVNSIFNILSSNSYSNAREGKFIRMQKNIQALRC